MNTERGYSGPFWFNKAALVVAVLAIFTVIIGWLNAGNPVEWVHDGEDE